MRVNIIRPAHLGAVMLGVAMGALQLGYALFFLSPSLAKTSPELWASAASTTASVTLLALLPHRTLKRSRH